MKTSHKIVILFVIVISVIFVISLASTMYNPPGNKATIDDFRKVLSESPDIDTIFDKFGEPDSDIGSGIHIYVYKLDDSTEIRIGYAGTFVYVQHVDSNGTVLEQLI